MARPTSTELTQRELEVMHVFWQQGELTAMQAREALASRGISRAYVTIANLVRILLEKGFLEVVSSERPFRYRSARSFEEVSGSLIRDLMQRVFHGSREMLLVQVLSGKKLSRKERQLLQRALEEPGP
jgi:predicted transcriptional regulator